MAYTGLIVEFSPTTNPLDTPSWVDISSYVIGQVNIRRGRSSEFDTYGTGTCSFTLDNSTRTFDPSYASGAYYGNLLAKRRIRVRTSGQTLFTGWVQGWPQSLDWRQRRSWVQITAQDGLGLLSGISLDLTPYEAEVLADSPVSFMRMRSPDDGASVVGNVTFADDTEVDTGKYPGMDPGGIRFPPNVAPLDGYAGVLLGAPLSGTTQTLELWLRCEHASYERRLITAYDGVSSGWSVVVVNSDGTATLKSQAGSVIVTSTVVADGGWHQLAFTSNNTTVSCYVDGVLVSTATSSEEVFTATGAAFYVRTSVGFLISPYQQYDGDVRAFSFYTSVLSAARIAAHYNGAKGWPDDLSGARIQRYLTAAGWPSALTSLDGGTAVMPVEGRMSGSVLDLCQQAAIAEGGAFFGTPTGTVQFRHRTATNEVAAYNSTQATFGPSGADLRFEDAAPADDDQLVRNVVYASREGGKVYTYEDATSIAKYFRISDESASGMFLKNDADVTARGQWILLRYASPTPRLDHVTVNARQSSGALSAVQTLDILHRIVVKVPHPNGVGSATTYTVQIEAVEHSVDMSNGGWITTYRGSPADTNTYFIIGTSALGGAAVLAY